MGELDRSVGPGFGQSLERQPFLSGFFEANGISRILQLLQLL